MNLEEKLLKILYEAPNSDEIGELAEHLEQKSDFILNKNSERLKGIWELRWSSSKSPFLRYSPFIDNLQIIDPVLLKAMNLLKPKGINKIIGSAILAKLDQINSTRIGVTFTHAGILGPNLGRFKIKALAKINKLQEGWLDITYLDNNIRICRGDKGTLFVLVKRKNVDLFKDFTKFNEGFNS